MHSSPVGLRNILLALLAGVFFTACSPHKQGKTGAAVYITTDSTLRPLLHMEDSARFFKMIDSSFDDSPWGLFFKYSRRAEYSRFHNKSYQALAFNDSMLSAIQFEQNDPAYHIRYAQTLLARGDLMLNLHRPDEAFKQYFAAREEIVKTGDTCLSSDYTNTLANTNYNQKKYNAAATLYKQGFAELNACTKANGYDRFVYQQGTLDNIGLCFGNLGLNDSAVFYYDSALRYIDLRGKDINPIFVSVAKAIIYGNKAKTLIERGEDVEAEKLLKESIAINSRPGYTYATGDVPEEQAKLAALYLKQHRVVEAGNTLQQMKAQLDTMPNISMLQLWNQLQSGYYESTGNLVASIASLKRYLFLKDSASSAHQSLLSTDIDKEFTYLESMYTVSALQKENQLKNLSLVITVLGIVMTGIILLLVRRNYRQSKKNVAALQELNEEVNVRNHYLQDTLNALEKSEAENTRMLKIIAHDLRNPVGGITTLTGLMLGDTNYTEEQRRQLELMRLAGDQSMKMIEDILYINMPLSDITRRPLNLQTMLERNIGMMRLAADKKNQQITLTTEEAVIDGDGDKLWRVFSNLISNAIKFSPDRGTITVQLFRKGHAAVVTIADNGIGIPQHLLEKLFDIAAADVRRAGTQGEPSFGLGLAICRQIAEAHEGSIWVESETGRGTTFYVSIPLANQ